MIKIAVTDDHELIRSGIAMLLRNSSEFEVVLENGSGEELLEALAHTEVDVALVDVTMGGINGLETIALCKEKFPHVKCIVLTIHDEGQYVLKAIRSGAYGYLLKDCDEKELKEAIIKVYQGKKHFNQNVSDLMIESVTLHSDIQKLSGREQEVLELVAAGKTTKQIADLLFVSSRTVETHRRNILKKLEVQNTAELIRKATSLGLLAKHP